MSSRFSDFLLTRGIAPPKSAGLPLAIMALLIAAAFGWLTYLETGKLVRLAASGVQIEATVVETSRRARGLPRATRVKYWFMDDRRQNRFGDFSTWSSYLRGDKLQIVYDRREPTLSAPSIDWLFANIVLYAALSVIAAVTGVRQIRSFHSMTTPGQRTRTTDHLTNLS